MKWCEVADVLRVRMQSPRSYSLKEWMRCASAPLVARCEKRTMPAIEQAGKARESDAGRWGEPAGERF